jgi:hypothetical protein
MNRMMQKIILPDWRGIQYITITLMVIYPPSAPSVSVPKIPLYSFRAATKALAVTAAVMTGAIG